MIERTSAGNDRFRHVSPVRRVTTFQQEPEVKRTEPTMMRIAVKGRACAAAAST